MKSLKQTIMERDDLTDAQAEIEISEARQAILDGEDPEEVLADYFGLEPDYMFDLI